MSQINQVNQHILDRLFQLEATNAVRQTLNRYMEICDHLDASTDLDALMNVFTADAIWEGVGKRYQKSFGQLHGRAEIYAMFQSYTQKNAHFVMNAHFVNSEQIYVNATTAVGKWLMLQTSSFQDGNSHLNAAKLTVDFQYDTDHHCWKISHFRTENIFSRAVHPWSDQVDLPVPAQPTDQ